MGYLVHCLSDRLVLPIYFHHTFPFSMLKGRITKTTGPMLLEFLNIELLRQKSISIYGTNNSVLCELGIEDEYVTKFIREMNDYIIFPSIKSSHRLHQSLGLRSAPQAKKYEKYILLWRKMQFLKYVTPINISMRKINEKISTEIRSQISGLFKDEIIEDNSYKFLI